MNMLNFLSQPWHWSISGLMIVVVMFLLLWLGGQFGVSSNLRTLCSIGGAESMSDYFQFNWKSQIWNLVFIGSAVIGGYIGVTYLASEQPIEISSATQQYLSSKGISYPQEVTSGLGYVPDEIFGSEHFYSWRNLFLLIVGGFLVGFGARYAGGCTSGHAISGLSNLQIPSLIAVCGFFIGGLLMTWALLPFILTM